MDQAHTNSNILITPRMMLLPPPSYPAHIRQSGSSRELQGVAERPVEYLPKILDAQLPKWKEITPAHDHHRSAGDDSVECIIPILVITLSAIRGWELMNSLEDAIQSVKAEQDVSSGEDEDEHENDSQESAPSLKPKKVTVAQKKLSKTHKSSKKRNYVACLYGKHMKISDQLREIAQREKYIAGIATPGRLLSVLQSGSNAPRIDLAKTDLLVLDMYHDAKSFCLFSLNDTREGMLHALFPITALFLDARTLLRTYFLSHIIQGKTKILLF